MAQLKDFIGVTLFVSLIKILLFPCYKSTDFEVHRNWLATTHSLPLRNWYYADHSEWTLDYPPFFAFFEYLLSHIAVLIDPKIVDLSSLNYSSPACVYFQRSSVVVTDLLFAFAAYKWTTYSDLACHRRLGLFVVLVANCGLLMVDHVHFQYNGFLFGILLLSLYYIATDRTCLGALLFAALLNFKHIFVYVAPAFGVYLLRHYCFSKQRGSFSFNTVKFFQLAVTVCCVFLASFGPFVFHLPQIFTRLFPFKRGLTHSYWAPNAWAMYNFADKLLTAYYKKMEWIDLDVEDCFSKGVVQVCDHNVLPSVKPWHTFALTLISMLPCLWRLFFSPQDGSTSHVMKLVRGVQICSLCSFMFGWHVHEKAILMSIVPTTVLAFHGGHHDRVLFFVLQCVGHYSLFPLLHDVFSIPLRLLLWLIYNLLCFNLVFTSSGVSPKKENKIATAVTRCYLLTLLLNELFCIGVFPFTRYSQSHPFLPLMMTSVVSSVGVAACFLRSYQLLFASRESEKKES